jgi:hypothetical protein
LLLNRGELHHPLDAVFVPEHAEIRTPRAFADRCLHLPAERLVKIASASSLLSTLTKILLRFSCSFTVPKTDGTSFAISTFSVPIGRAMSMIFSASSSDTGNSGRAMSLKRMILVNSPPNTDL